METVLVPCPGCGLEMPRGSATYDGYFNASPECWSVFGEVLAAEFQNAVLSGQVHQLTVDTYAVQHAGGPHPDKSVCVHLMGLHLALEQGIAAVEVSRRLQRLASGTTTWPHFAPPVVRGPRTVLDVATADSAEDHARRVGEWAAEVWAAWREHHEAVGTLAARTNT